LCLSTKTKTKKKRKKEEAYVRLAEEGGEVEIIDPQTTLSTFK